MKRLFIFIVLSYFIFFFLFPPFQHPDEQSHFEVVYWITKGIYPYIPTKDIPGPHPGSLQQDFYANVVQHKNVKVNLQKIQSSQLLKQTEYPFNIQKQFVPYAGQAYNPPVYYLVGALFLNTAKLIHANLLNQIYIVRLTSSLFYFATVFAAYKLLSLLFPGRSVTKGLLLLFALNPLLIQSGVGISPDIAVTFFSMIFLLLIAKNKNKMNKYKNILIISIVIGFASLSKITGIVFVPSFIIYLYLQQKNNFRWLKPSLLFVALFLLTQIPWLLFNYLRYHTPIVATTALGAMLTNKVMTSPLLAITSSVWGYRHVFMHYSGFIGWNEAFPPMSIFTIYTLIFISSTAAGLFFAFKQKDNFNKFMGLSVIFLFLFFLCLDTVRKLYSHQSWEIGGRNALPIFLPLLLFSVNGIAKILKIKIENLATFLFYFSIIYYYYIVIFVLIPRYY